RDRRHAQHRRAATGDAADGRRNAGGLRAAQRGRRAGVRVMSAISTGEFHYLGHKMPYLPSDGCTGRLIVLEGTDGVGRSTQAIMLKEWLEVQGFAVLDTGWTRSKLVGQAITDAKQGHSLPRLTYCLMYATDLADRLEYQVIPALRSGFIVLADRYIYAALARGITRGADRAWLHDLFSFAIAPDLVLYLQLGVNDLIPRVLDAGKMNYWE